jgi:hypothetical protein
VSNTGNEEEEEENEEEDEGKNKSVILFCFVFFLFFLLEGLGDGCGVVEERFLGNNSRHIDILRGLKKK